MLSHSCHSAPPWLLNWKPSSLASSAQLLPSHLSTPTLQALSLPRSISWYLFLLTQPTCVTTSLLPSATKILLYFSYACQSVSPLRIRTILFLLEKELATHCSILAWRIPWTEEPGRLESMGSQRVGHNWVTSTHIISASQASAECLV